MITICDFDYFLFNPYCFKIFNKNYPRQHKLYFVYKDFYETFIQLKNNSISLKLTMFWLSVLSYLLVNHNTLNYKTKNVSFVNSFKKQSLFNDSIKT